MVEGKVTCQYCGYIYDSRPWLSEDLLHPYFCSKCSWIITTGYDPYPGRGYKLDFWDDENLTLRNFQLFIEKLSPLGLQLTPYPFHYGERRNLVYHYSANISTKDLVENALFLIHFPTSTAMIEHFGSWHKIMNRIGSIHTPLFSPILPERKQISDTFSPWQKNFLTQIQTVFLHTDILFPPHILEDSIIRYGNEYIQSYAWSQESAIILAQALLNAYRLLEEHNNTLDALNIKEVIKTEFGDWYKVFYASGLSIIKRTRGTIIHGIDGHLCLSIMEKTIDDLLTTHDIPHQKEVRYPYDPQLNPKGMRADWLLEDGTYVEYFGLTGTPDYDKKTQRKLALAQAFNLLLWPIYNDSDLQQLLAWQLSRKRNAP